MRIQTNQRRSLRNSRKRHSPETVEQKEQFGKYRNNRKHYVQIGNEWKQWYFGKYRDNWEVQPKLNWNKYGSGINRTGSGTTGRYRNDRKWYINGRYFNRDRRRINWRRRYHRVEHHKDRKRGIIHEKVKKIIVSFLLMCMLCVGMTCVASATAAEFRFSDPQTSVGAEVDVTAKVSSAKALNTIQATLSYDKTKLRFISGDDATGGDGNNYNIKK